MNCCSECYYYDICYDEYYDFQICLVGNDDDFKKIEYKIKKNLVIK